MVIETMRVLFLRKKEIKGSGSFYPGRIKAGDKGSRKPEKGGRGNASRGEGQPEDVGFSLPSLEFMKIGVFFRKQPQAEA